MFSILERKTHLTELVCVNEKGWFGSYQSQWNETFQEILDTENSSFRSLIAAILDNFDESKDISEFTSFATAIADSRFAVGVAIGRKDRSKDRSKNGMVQCDQFIQFLMEEYLNFQRYNYFMKPQPGPQVSTNGYRERHDYGRRYNTQKPFRSTQRVNWEVPQWGGGMNRPSMGGGMNRPPTEWEMNG